MRNAATETVLVIDSDWRALVATQEVLEKAGYKVVTRDRVSGSVQSILRDRPDVVLIDPEMPSISGDMLVKIVTSSESTSKALLLLYSSLPLHELHQRALACGADGYVQKSDSTARLVSQIKYWSTRVRAAVTSTARLRILPANLGHEESPIASADEPQSLTLVRATKPVVLFVDDEPAVLRSYRRDFATEDYNALFAQSGDEGALLLQAQIPPDVVVCDLLMPGTSGADLYNLAIARDGSWRKRFIFTTGFAGIDHISSFIQSVEAPVLRKPVDIQGLKDAIRIALIRGRIFNSRVRPLLAGHS